MSFRASPNATTMRRELTEQLTEQLIEGSKRTELKDETRSRRSRTSFPGSFAIVVSGPAGNRKALHLNTDMCTLVNELLARAILKRAVEKK